MVASNPDEKRLTLRLPVSLHELVEARAAVNHRSVNNEILVLIKLGLMAADAESKVLREFTASYRIGPADS